MYLVAQRVATPQGEGINAFFHVHGQRPDWVWEPPDGVPDQDPGELLEDRSIINIRGQGRIRSFLDIAAPDGTTAAQLYWAHNAVLALVGAGAQFPVVIVSGSMFVRYEVEFQLRQHWHQELHALLDTALQTVPNP